MCEIVQFMMLYDKSAVWVLCDLLVNLKFRRVIRIIFNRNYFNLNCPQQLPQNNELKQSNTRNSTKHN